MKQNVQWQQNRMDTMNDAASIPEKKELDLEHRIAQLRQLRAKIKIIKEEQEKFLERWTTAEKALGGTLMQWLLDHKIKTANTKVGNITWVDNTTYPIEDLKAFSRFVIDSKIWEMLDWKANKTAVVDYIKEHKDPTDPDVINLPPGLRENPHPHLRVSSPTGEKKASTNKKLKFDTETPEEE